MAVDIQTLEERYIASCKRLDVSPNPAILSGLFKADVSKSREEPCILEIYLEYLKDNEIEALMELFLQISASEIEAVDVRSEILCALSGGYALSLIRAIGHKLRIVDIQDFSFGKDFLRGISQRGLTCHVLNLRRSHFRKLNMMGEFTQLRSLNLDFSTSLTNFKEDCFTCMPNLMYLSMCETSVANLWTTSAALSKLPCLLELRFQNLVCCNDSGTSDGTLGADDIIDLSEVNNRSPMEASAMTLAEFRDHVSTMQEARRSLFYFDNMFIDNEHQTFVEDSSDDSEVDFSTRRLEYAYLGLSSNTVPGQNRDFNLPDELSFDPLSNQNEEGSSAGNFIKHHPDVPLKYISSHASPICFEKYYREYMIASLPKLKVLDNLPIRKIDQERASLTFSQHFEYLPYRRRQKENVASILQKREIQATQKNSRAPKQNSSYPSGKSQYNYKRSLCATKVASSAWPFLHSLSLSSNDLGDESRSFRPRQFEYHPCVPYLMVVGTLDGEVVVVNHENGKIVSHIPSLGSMSSVLGLCWLRKYPSKLIAGSDNGSLKLYDIQHMPPTNGNMSHGTRTVTFDEFDQLTSVHVNSVDELFLASGYSKDVALYDIGSGRRMQVFTDMHREHINVVKFSNHSPSLFATSSFDQDVKMWDLRQKPVQSCYTASSSKGNVMVCFSPDDHYLLVSAVDNEVRQLQAVDGRLLLNFEIPATGSSQNYTRSYYLNGRDYVISGSCDEHVVRICCSQTGRRLRDVSLEGKGSTSMFVQSLRGDPFRDFNMSVLAAYMRPSSKSEIVKVNLLTSTDYYSEDYSRGQYIPPSRSRGA